MGSFGEVADALEDGLKKHPSVEQVRFCDVAMREGRIVKACAHGAIALGVGLEDEEVKYLEEGMLVSVSLAVNREFPQVDWMYVACPVSTCHNSEDEPINFEWPYLRMSVNSMIIHLNDEHNWTFEQVAYWLRGLD